MFEDTKNGQTHSYEDKCNPPHEKPTTNERFDELVRDITKVGFMAKSEARQRLGVIISQEKSLLLDQAIEELAIARKPFIENMLQDDEVFEEHGIDGVKGFNQALSQAMDKLKELKECEIIGEQSQSSVAPTGSFGNPSPVIGKWPGPVTGNY